MTRIGCGIAVLGVLLMGCSFALFGFSIMRALEARQIASIPIVVGEEFTTDIIEVDTARLCQVAFQVDVRTESAQEKDPMRVPNGEPMFEARYDFPFRCSVVDADGKTVYSGSNHVAWNSGSITTTANDVDETGGTVSVEHTYNKFKVPPPGQIRVHIEFEPDKTYEAEAQKVTLNVYDNVSSQGTSVFGGCATFIFGPVLIFCGITVCFIGLVTGKQKGKANGQPPREHRDSAG